MTVLNSIPISHTKAHMEEVVVGAGSGGKEPSLKRNKYTRKRNLMYFRLSLGNHLSRCSKEF